MRNYKKIVIVFFLLLITKTSYSQINSEENEVFKTIIHNHIQNGYTQIILSCDKSTTTGFNIERFIKETGLKNTPKTILKEININTKENKVNKKWNQDNINTLKIGHDFLKYNYCINKNKIKDCLKNREKAFKITKPIFDNKKQHCIVSLIIFSKDSSYFSSFFLKKVYGEWIVIETFDTFLS